MHQKLIASHTADSNGAWLPFYMDLRSDMGNVSGTVMTIDYYYPTRGEYDSKYTGSLDELGGLLVNMMIKVIHKAESLDIDFKKALRNAHVGELHDFRHHEYLKSLLSKHGQKAGWALDAFEEAIDACPKLQNLAQIIALKRASVNVFSLIEQKKWDSAVCYAEIDKQIEDFRKEAQGENRPDKLGDELADIFHAVIRLADVYQIDLPEVWAARNPVSPSGGGEWI